MSGNIPQRSASSTFYFGRDAKRKTHLRVEQDCNRYASLNAPSPSLSTLYPIATTDTPAASGETSPRLHIGVCVPLLFICFSLVYSREFGKGASRPALEHFCLLVDSLAFTLVLCSPAWCYLFGWGFVRYASPFISLGPSSRTHPPRGIIFPALGRAVSSPCPSVTELAIRYIGDCC